MGSKRRGPAPSNPSKRRSLPLLVAATLVALGTGVAAFVARRARLPFWLEAGSKGAVAALAFDPSGTWLVGADDRCGLSVWSTEDRAVVHEESPGDESSLLDALTFTPGGLLATSVERGVTLRRLPGLEEVRKLDAPGNARDEARIAAVKTLVASVRPCGGTDDEQTETRVWEDGKILWSARRAEAEPLLLAFASGGDRLVSVSRDGQLTLRTARTGAEVVAVKSLGHLTAGAASAPDGLVALGIMTGGGRNVVTSPEAKPRIELRDLAGKLVRTLELEEPGKDDVTDGALWVTSLAFSPDGRTLAATLVHGAIGPNRAGTAKGWLELRDVSSGGRVMALDLGPEDAYAVAFSPDGERLAVARGKRVLVFPVDEPPSASFLGPSK